MTPYPNSHAKRTATTGDKRATFWLDTEAQANLERARAMGMTRDQAVRKALAVFVREVGA